MKNKTNAEGWLDTKPLAIKYTKDNEVRAFRYNGVTYYPESVPVKTLLELVKGVGDEIKRINEKINILIEVDNITSEQINLLNKKINEIIKLNKTL